MNFQDLKNVEDYQFFLDLAVRAADKKASALRSSIKLKSVNKLIKSKRIEIDRLKIMQEVICTRLNEIHMKFPSVDDLPEFYNQLIKLNLDVDMLKKSLGSVSWAQETISKLFTKTIIQLKRSEDVKEMTIARRATLGRVASILKQIDKFLTVIEESRKIMKTFPAVKTSIFTIAIVGFPNVGKSTLLEALTSASPEINSYAFTTKKLNIGYLKKDGKKYQFIDTPGTLARFNKMNPIEKQASLAMKYAAHVIIYVYDLSDQGYHIDDQHRLFEDVKDLDKPIIVYLSKTDIIDEKIVKDFISKHKDMNIITDKTEIINEVLRLEKDVFDE
jgi:nucleolar GTP-binding protein